MARSCLNVFCVNVDVLIATLLLKLLWRRYRDGSFTEHDLEDAAFTVFLFGRMIGCAAEMDGHQNPRPQYGHPHPAEVGHVRVVTAPPTPVTTLRVC
ncbi:MAG: hypothetical protein V9G19_09435 [Tetrasphaera sp.]